MLDPQRFARGVEPDPAVLRQVMVRRLKDDIRNPDGSPRFRGRVTRAIEVTYTEAEREAHALLAQYAALRRQAPGLTTGRAGDLVTLLLKKRLFSAPAAFTRTLHGYVDSHGTGSQRTRAAGAAGPGEAELPGWLADALDWDSDPADDEAGGDAERALLDRIADLQPASSVMEEALLAQLMEWADRHGEPADSKAKALIGELTRICRPGGAWNDERVIVFTEYVATQDWLAGLLDARGLAGDQLALLNGGMEERRREHLKAAFQAAPDRDPVRILLATDAASEGIDLQRHCHRVIHYDIPFNPNRLEQRIGRVDRHGQNCQVEVVHFVGAGWQHAAAGSYEGDLEYLSRVAEKVAVERKDLGSVNPVLAHAVEARMLGRPVLIDPLTVPVRVPASLLRAEEDLRGQIARLREQLDASVRRLHVAPANVRRVVDTALALASQPPLADMESAGLVAPPDLRAGWERTVTGLADPLSGVPRPLTFDPALAEGRDDVVLAHLEHPLVAQATRLLRSAIWGGRTPLHRLAAVRVTLPEEADIDGVLVSVFARLVIVGADGGRLHEEVMLAARAVPDSGRSRRVELEQPRYERLREAVEDALEPDASRVAPEATRLRMVARWPELEPLLAEDVRVRAGERLTSLQKTLARREEDEARRTKAVFDQLQLTLRAAVEGPGPVQLTLDDLDDSERQQLDRDRRAWQTRLDGLEDERTRELASIAARYAGVRELVFPFAVALCVPDDRTDR
jgi:hypothetical protein